MLWALESSEDSEPAVPRQQGPARSLSSHTRSRVRRFGRMDCARPDLFPLRCILVPDTGVTRGILLRLCRPSSVVSLHACAIPEPLCPQPCTGLYICSFSCAWRPRLRLWTGPMQEQQQLLALGAAPLPAREMPPLEMGEGGHAQGATLLERNVLGCVSMVVSGSRMQQRAFSSACNAADPAYKVCKDPRARRPGTRHGGLGRRPELSCSCIMWAVGMAWDASRLIRMCLWVSVGVRQLESVHPKARYAP